MKEVEVLSPVGDIDGFYASIRSGCDAVYMGLPKFNARMRAENITLENLPNLVKYAHLKGVKVYITMNTLLSDKELNEAVVLAGKCLDSGVDAFIVQDLGLISILKKVYPHIVLHGSTQLGVHNVAGAKVAKDLGLTRIVLSRECRIADIIEIKQNVDIEIEVFVQGANCICFSGNCYLSSIKCGASGNRGECKQLCRLPYVLNNGECSLKGYTLSPRDNCMLPYLKDLIAAGVMSLKIEGRLRQIGYISVATSVYRRAVDSILDGKPLDINNLENELYSVFARGEYTAGYNDGNNIVDSVHNNHLGAKIGKMVRVSRFKDLYKIELYLNRTIRAGDGLKFVYGNNDVVSIGVGNIESNGKNICVFAKNKVLVDSDVYLSKDSGLEESVSDFSRYRPLHITADVRSGQPLVVVFSSGDYVAKYEGDILSQANNRPITSDNIMGQLSKVDKSIWSTPTFDIVADNAFLPLSKLNDIRRNLISELENKIANARNVDGNINNLDRSNANALDNCANIVSSVQTSCVNENLQNTNAESMLSGKIAIIDENANIAKLAKEYDGLILSPGVYDLDIIQKFMVKYNKYFDGAIIINLPNIARCEDLKIIDSIVGSLASSNVIFIANNIYGLKYCAIANVWAGAGLNIVNKSSESLVRTFGVKGVIGSVEKWTSRLSGTYKFSEYPLMTITSCPVKLLTKCNCGNCKYVKNMHYIGDTFGLIIRRYKVSNCYFELYDANRNKVNENNCNIVNKLI